MRFRSNRFGTNGISNRIGPYHYADGAMEDIELERAGESGVPPMIKRHFKIIIAGAFNAFGLIGSEHNGIVILDNDNKLVILDEHARADSGYYGPTNHQVDEFEKILKMNYEQFMVFCRTHPRSRTPELDLTPDHGTSKSVRGEG